jgi:hypothetical protein
MTAEWPAYPDLGSTVYVILRNDSGEEVTTGSEFALEVDLGSGGAFDWRRLTVKPNVSWTAIEYVIAPGGAMALACHLSAYESSFLTDGHFRVVKDVGEQVCTAEFTVSGDAPISADAPYGFLPLEDLPADYGGEDAVADGCVVLRTGQSPINGDAIDLFLEKVGLGIPCQLRMARLTTEGALELEDVTYEYMSGAGGRFSWRWDNSRDGFAMTPQISAAYYSYLQTDGQDIYLSNAVERSHSYGASSLRWLSGEEAAPYVAAVQALTEDTLQSSGIRCRVWSDDGTQYAGLIADEPLEFCYGGAGYGDTCSLTAYDGLEQEILGIGWADDHTLLLQVRELDPENSRGCAATRLWDIPTGRMTEGPASA